jgi:hypothetical protein
MMCEHVAVAFVVLLRTCAFDSVRVSNISPAGVCVIENRDGRGGAR